MSSEVKSQEVDLTAFLRILSFWKGKYPVRGRALRVSAQWRIDCPISSGNAPVGSAPACSTKAFQRACEILPRNAHCKWIATKISNNMLKTVLLFLRIVLVRACLLGVHVFGACSSPPKCPYFAFPPCHLSARTFAVPEPPERPYLCCLLRATCVSILLRSAPCHVATKQQWKQGVKTWMSVISKFACEDRLELLRNVLKPRSCCSKW